MNNKELCELKECLLSSQNLACIVSPNAEMSVAFGDQGCHFNVFGRRGCQRLPCEFCLTYYLVTVVNQLALGPVSSPSKCILLPFLPCEIATFQGGGGGGDSPPSPRAFRPCW